MRNKSLTDDEKFNLQTALAMFQIPDDVIESVLSSGKAQLVNKYFLQGKNFVLETKQGSFKLPFSAVKVSSGFEALKSPNDEISKLKEFLKTDSPNESATKPSLPTELDLTKKGRGKGKKQALSRTSLTCLIDSSDAQILEQLATAKDVSISHLVRSAIKMYLKNGVKNEYNL
jgi:hypothetical protein